MDNKLAELFATSGAIHYLTRGDETVVFFFHKVEILPSGKLKAQAPSIAKFPTSAALLFYCKFKNIFNQKWIKEGKAPFPFDIVFIENKDWVGKEEDVRLYTEA